MMSISKKQKVCLSIASKIDREEIYKIRHSIYAQELNQHPVNTSEQLIDKLDVENNYIVAKQSDKLLGFISITSPNSEKYSVDKYFSRENIPVAFDEYLYEIRLLTVLKENRYSLTALILMFAAFRWVQSHGGKHIVAICRSDLLDMYRKAGLQPLSLRTQSGKVTYELAIASVENLQTIVEENQTLYESLRKKIDWQLPFLFFAVSPCYHGGSFFKAIGEDLQKLNQASQIINADVLDAWFPPAPKVLEALRENLTFLIQTSPPTYADGMIKKIAEARGIHPQYVFPGAGSSDLIFLSLTSLLNSSSNVLIIDPCYGEYIHVLEKVIKCKITRFKLTLETGFAINTSQLLNEINKGYDLVVLVNPNSPTGVHTPKKEMEELIHQVPKSTLVWLDETYVEFVGSAQSLEQFAVKTENLIVCKSMSKVYALSGIRAAYLCCSPHFIEIFKQFSPPWSVSLPAQAASIAALQSEEYYQEQYALTHLLKEKLIESLKLLGITEIVPGVANFLLFYLPANFPEKGELLESCRQKNLYMRDVGNMGENLAGNAIRIAVKDELTNARMIHILKKSLAELMG